VRLKWSRPATHYYIISAHNEGRPPTLLRFSKVLSKQLLYAVSPYEEVQVQV